MKDIPVNELAGASEADRDSVVLLRFSYEDLAAQVSEDVGGRVLPLITILVSASRNAQAVFDGPDLQFAKHLRVKVEDVLESLLDRSSPQPFDVARVHDCGKRRDEARGISADVGAGSAVPHLGRVQPPDTLMETSEIPAHDPSAPRSVPCDVAPRHVRRAEEYMRRNLAKSMTSADLAREVGVSVRALQTGFRRFRGTTPLATLRSLRLDSARLDLERGEASDNVTAIALKWGFTHLSRFSESYRVRFGELPMQTLRCRRTEREGTTRAVRAKSGPRVLGWTI